jgi:hypothetical protein
MSCFACQQVASEDTVLYTAQAYADKPAEAQSILEQAVAVRAARTPGALPPPVAVLAVGISPVR